jgi:predicted acyltransferase
MIQTKTNQRIETIDQFRGLAIILMILANYLAGVKWTPAWLKHAPDIGLTIIDLVAPFFIFAIGLTFGVSLRRRAARDGWEAAIRHGVIRYLALVGIGALLSAGEVVFGFETGRMDWGVLQAIGLAGLVILPAMRLSPLMKASLGFGLLAVYQYFLDHSWLDLVIGSPHGGLLGSPGWVGMLLLATVLADLLMDGKIGKKYGIAVLVILVLGIILAFWLPVSKNRVSMSYVLITLGASGVLFGLFAWLNGELRLGRVISRSGLAAWGKNPLALYLLHLVALGLFALPPVPGWYVSAPGWLVLLQVAFILISLGWVAKRFEARGIFLTL